MHWARYSGSSGTSVPFLGAPSSYFSVVSLEALQTLFHYLGYFMEVSTTEAWLIKLMVVGGSVNVQLLSPSRRLRGGAESSRLLIKAWSFWWQKTFNFFLFLFFLLKKIFLLFWKVYICIIYIKYIYTHIY